MTDTVDTSAEAVERLAHHASKLLMGTTLGDPVPATLRALAAERDALLTDNHDLSRQSEISYAERDAARADAEALRDEVAHLQEALSDVASFLPDLDYAKSYLRRLHDMRPAMEHAAQIVAALAQKEADDE
jgi:hypothetical protein